MSCCKGVKYVFEVIDTASKPNFVQGDPFSLGFWNTGLKENGKKLTCGFHDLGL